MSHLLIYDADLSGHHQDYLDAVLAYVEAHSELSNGVTKVSFMLPSGYWQAGSEKRSTQFANRLDIEAQSLERRNALSPRRRAIFEVEMLIRTVEEHQIDELFLMNIDYFQVALASPLARSLACRISGIQLQPYTRSEIVARGYPFSITLLFRALRKRLRLEQMIRNVDVSRLCIPADTAAVDLLNRRHSAQLSAIMLPEPYLGAGSVSSASDSVVLPDVYERYSLNSNCKIILAFGNIITRKKCGECNSRIGNNGAGKSERYRSFGCW